MKADKTKVWHLFETSKTSPKDVFKRYSMGWKHAREKMSKLTRCRCVLDKLMKAMCTVVMQHWESLVDHSVFKWNGLFAKNLTGGGFGTSDGVVCASSCFYPYTLLEYRLCLLLLTFVERCWQYFTEIRFRENRKGFFFMLLENIGW